MKPFTVVMVLKRLQAGTYSVVTGLLSALLHTQDKLCTERETLRGQLLSESGDRGVRSLRLAVPVEVRIYTNYRE